MITKIDGRRSSDADDLVGDRRALEPGQTVTGRGVPRRRAPERQVKLGERPARAAAARADAGAVAVYRPAPCSSPSSLAHKSLADYTHIVGRAADRRGPRAGRAAGGPRVVHLSATAFGGGVSEILYTLVPLMRDVGLEVEWQVIYGREEFFNATKLMHNALQGNPQDLTEEQWATWAQYNEMNARELSRGWDVCIVHDPQPAALPRSRPEKARGVGVALPHRHLDAEPGDDGAAAAVHPALPRVALPRRRLRAGRASTAA